MTRLPLVTSDSNPLTKFCRVQNNLGSFEEKKVKQGWLAKWWAWYACVIIGKEVDACVIIDKEVDATREYPITHVHSTKFTHGYRRNKAWGNTYRYDKWHLHLCNTPTKVKIISVCHCLIPINDTSLGPIFTRQRQLINTFSLFSGLIGFHYLRHF